MLLIPSAARTSHCRRARFGAHARGQRKYVRRLGVRIPSGALEVPLELGLTRCRARRDKSAVLPIRVRHPEPGPMEMKVADLRVADVHRAWPVADVRARPQLTETWTVGR